MRQKFTFGDIILETGLACVTVAHETFITPENGPVKQKTTAFEVWTTIYTLPSGKPTEVYVLHGRR